MHFEDGCRTLHLIILFFRMEDLPVPCFSAVMQMDKTSPQKKRGKEQTA